MATSDQMPAGETCPRCFGSITATATEHYCEACGLVTEDSPIDHGPDWRDFGDGDSPERAMPGNRNHPDRGLGTDTATGHRRRDRIAGHTRSGSKRDRNRAYATGEIHRMTAALELPESVGERAKRVFRDLHGATSLEGYDLDTLAASCLYCACRKRQLGRTAGDVAAVARADERPIARRLWWVADVCGLEVPPPSAEARVRVVGARLDADRETVRDAVGRISEDGSGSPSVRAALALYQSDKWMQKTVAEAAGVTPAAVRDCRKRVSFA